MRAASDKRDLLKSRPTATGNRMVRICALSLAVGLNAAYAMFLLGGPALAFLASILAIQCAATVVLLARRPVYLLASAMLIGALAYCAVFNLIWEWDARSIWFLHGRMLFLGAGPVELLRDAPDYSHAAYPKLVALGAATMAWVAGLWNEALPKLVVPVLLFVPLIYLLGAWRRAVPLLIIFGLVYLILGRFLWNGYVDGILAAYAVAAVVAARRWLDDGDPVDGLAFIAIAALLPTLKAEGLLALGAITVGLGARLAATGEWRRILGVVRPLALFGTLTMAAPLGWYVFVSLSGLGAPDILQGDALTRFVSRLGDGHSLMQILRAVFLDGFVVVWLLVALSIFALGSSDVRRAVGPFLAAALVFATGLTALYLMTAVDLVWHLSSSADRTSMTIALLLAVAIVPAPERDTLQRPS